MARSRVLVSGRALVAYLELPLWETARAALRLLADDPRPSWAARTTVGFTFYLPDRSWVAYASTTTRRSSPPSARARRQERRRIAIPS